ncbi:MAG: hypothetical protein ACXVDD_21605, partial [Polyangia bacterium]
MVKQITITSITGNVSGGAANVHLHLEAAAAINKLTSGMNDLHVDVGHAPVVVDYVGGHLGMTAHVKGTASYAPGGQEKVSGKFDVGWDNGFSAHVTDIKITAGEGFKSEGGSIDLTAGDINIGTCTFKVQGLADGTVTGGGNVKSRTFTLDSDVDVTALRGLKVHVHADNTEVKGELKAPVPITIGPAKVTLLDGCSASFARGPGGGFSSHLHAKVELEKIGHADLSADYSKTAG